MNQIHESAMKKFVIQLSLLAFLSGAVATLPVQSLAQSTNKTPAEKKATAQSNDSTKTEKTTKAGPFHGKLAAVDKVAKTITVGKRTFEITSETKIKKAGKPATLEDGTPGEMVSGYVKPTADGKLIATTVNFGPKNVSETSEKTKANPDKDKEKQPK